MESQDSVSGAGRSRRLGSLVPLLVVIFAVAAFMLVRRGDPPPRIFPGPVLPEGELPASFAAEGGDLVAERTRAAGAFNPPSPDAVQLAVVVRDASGAGVPEAYVSALVPDSSIVLVAAPTDTSGRVVLLLPAGTRTTDIAVYSVAHPPVVEQRVVAPGSVEVNLSEGWTQSGQVVDARGSPILGAHVLALGPGVPVGVKVLDAAPVPPYLDRRIVRTAADGTFTVSGLAPGHSYWVSAWAPGLAGTYEQEISGLNEVTWGQQSALRIALFPLYRSRIKFLDEQTGQPICHPRVALKSLPVDLPHDGVGFAASSPFVAGPTPGVAIDLLWVSAEERREIAPFAVQLGGWAGYQAEPVRVAAVRSPKLGEAMPPIAVSLRRGPQFQELGGLRIGIRMSGGGTLQAQHAQVKLSGTLVHETSGLAIGVDLTPGIGEEVVELDRLPPGRYHLRLSNLGPTEAYIRAEPATVLSGTTTDMLVRFPPVGAVRLTLTAHLVARPYGSLTLIGDAGGARYEVPDVSLRGGEYVLGYVLPGTYAATFSTPDHLPSQHTVVVQPNGVSALKLAPPRR